jgi:hypothetical protein
MRGGGAPKGAILNLPPGEHRCDDAHLACASRTDLAKPARAAPPCRRSAQQRFLSPDRFRMYRRCAGFHLALVPAMAASYGRLPVIGAGRSTGASRGGLRATPQAPHPLHFETPPEAPSLSGQHSYTGLLEIMPGPILADVNIEPNLGARSGICGITLQVSAMDASTPSGRSDVIRWRIPRTNSRSRPRVCVGGSDGEQAPLPRGIEAAVGITSGPNASRFPRAQTPLVRTRSTRWFRRFIRVRCRRRIPHD